MRRTRCNDGAEILSESHGQCRDGAGLNDCEDHPSIEECWKLAVCFTEKNILTAGLREHAAEFGDGKTSEQRDSATRDPYKDKSVRPAQAGGDLSGSEEDARSDDAADQ